MWELCRLWDGSWDLRDSGKGVVHACDGTPPTCCRALARQREGGVCGECDDTTTNAGGSHTSGPVSWTTRKRAAGAAMRRRSCRDQRGGR